MKKNFIILFLIALIPIKAFALIEVDITRGNLNPLPLAVSPLSIDDKSKKVLKKFLKKKILVLKFLLLLKII
jgi:TolB protein